MRREHDEPQRIPVISDPAVVRIAKALAALAQALPGSTYVTICKHGGKRASVSIACESDDAARAIAAQFGHETVTVGNADECWLKAEGDATEDVRLDIYGPHRKRPAPLDESKVATALAQAETAL